MKNIKLFFEVLLKTLKGCILSIVKRIELVWKLFLIVVPITFVYTYYQDFCLCFAIFLLDVVILTLDKVTTGMKQTVNGFPICKKRFTHKSETNSKVIYIKNEDMLQALMYLYEVENYAERNGLK
jgi:hypothetical protein